MEMKATLRHLGIAPRKVRLMAAVVKGMTVARAERELMSRTKRSAPILLKLLRSAIANARHNFHIENQNLKVKDLRIDAGPVTARFRARAFGRAAPIRRRTSHVSLILETVGDVAAPARGVRKAAPVAREATADDVRGSSLSGRGSGAQKRQPKKKSSGFMPRIFQRKAI
ncbi:MAG: 50S ribosomal protein L22 [Candidatus Sungbacteria bacterium RIFCSPLOWO2_02_FULL_54_10]|uniref:Large ribosomal subunit protein uL22 n=2 Tax=Candidatus Sungiibacteriota TaxID=1817917 RepID=A0A1G2L970_9BACT|nr:MAG: 50S ribosomal protein L22 [Candidatus Sungbacteria bacterium RIFCSPHIGHO2_01_FULL_54_26]OHA02787.1 MAG: 50S ribosomal protein L22 [Candidatus Sungbacteria bacterium RIFCSPHIGHO2_02_FULL_53_17]OHA08188.1 MAG: 50S ribosomal protein L22 [Candidatus Sungbacteria bacterium RIFCSPLOWO2_01_FULL_54_21]OHA12615.1 MAG: 50S ribosomal protein L22 [Candidatus Sungbacteria bacterium RIFCSPLOWO2_02_FULL_54_10]